MTLPIVLRLPIEPLMDVLLVLGAGFAAVMFVVWLAWAWAHAEEQS